MSKLGRRIVIGSFSLVALLIAAVATLLVVLHTDWGREKVRERVEDQLDGVFFGGGTLGKLEGSPFGELVGRNLVINDPGGEPAIRAKTVRIRLALLPLLSKEARIESLIVEDAEVFLARDARGELKISRLTRPGPKSGWSTELSDVRLHRAHIMYEDAAGERMHFDNIELRADASLPAEDPIAAAVKLTGQWRERGGLPLELDASVRSGDELWVDRLFARAGGVVVTGEDVRVGKTPAGRPAISGTVSVKAPRAEVARLGVGVETPVDLSLRANAARVPGTNWTRVELAGWIGNEPLTAQVRADLDARRFAGFVSTGTLDATTLTQNRLHGSLNAFLSFDAALQADRELPVGTAMLHARGTLEDVPETTVRVALTSNGERASTVVEVAGRELSANASAEIGKRGRALTLHRAALSARSGDPMRSTGGKAPLRGSLRAELTAHGALAPAPSLAVSGTVDGRRLRFADLSIGSLKLAVDAKQLPARPLGRAELVAHDIARGTMYLNRLAVTAADRADGKLAVAVRTQPKQQPWLVEVDALVTPAEVIAIDLVRHHVRAGAGADWRGDSGRVVISPQRIELRDFASKGPSGALAVDGTFHRAGRRAGDVEARVEAKDLALDNFDPDFRGTASANVELQRRGGRLAARAHVAGRGLSLDPMTPPLEVEADVDVREGRLALGANASGVGLGRVEVAADLNAPRDAADGRAWQRLGADAIRDGRIKLDGVDVGRLAKLAGQVGEHRGKIDGEIRLAGTTPSGGLALRGLVTPSTKTLGGIDADLTFAPVPSGLVAPSLAVRIPDLGRVDATAAIKLPARPFDPLAWQKLGRGALVSAQVRTSELAFDPEVLAKLGVLAELRGRAALTLELEEAARVAKVSARVRELSGGPLAEPVAIELAATAGTDATTFRLTAAAAATRLFEASGRVTGSLEQLRADPLAAPLAVTAKLPDVPAARLLAVLGRRDVGGGTLSGTIDVAGTVGAPTGRARITAANIFVPRNRLVPPPKPLDRLTIDASWDGRAGTVALAGTQPGGSLSVTAKGTPEALDRATVTVRAKQFDLGPVLVFAPGAAGAAGGVLDADLTVTSLDPRTMKLAGELHVVAGRVPLAPTIGTLRQAKIDVTAGARDIRMAVDGRLGDGRVKASGTIDVDGAAPTGGALALTLRGVSPIGALEPRIDADVTTKLTKAADRWIADVVVRNGAVRVPEGRGEELKPVGAPPDMVFLARGVQIGDVPDGRVTREEKPPAVPVIEARVKIEPTYVESKELRGEIRGQLTITADAQAVGMVGHIEAVRADLDLFGRRYILERAAARFDGPPDPLLDVVITHDFPEVRTITSVRGRLSKPELIMSSEPAIYSQGQLLGFLLGGEPNGEPATGNPRDRVTAAGTSLVANQIAGYVKKALPFDVDVLKYEAATGSSSAAVTVGTWLTRSLFIAYRRRFEARADENTGEAEAEYWITRRVMFEGVLGDRGYSGLDLLWRKRY